MFWVVMTKNRNTIIWDMEWSKSEWIDRMLHRQDHNYVIPVPVSQQNLSYWKEWIRFLNSGIPRTCSRCLYSCGSKWDSIYLTRFRFNGYISRYDSWLHLYYKKFWKFVYDPLLFCPYYFANGLKVND